MPYNNSAYSAAIQRKVSVYCLLSTPSWRTRIMRVSPEPASYARDFSQRASRSRR